VGKNTVHQVSSISSSVVGGVSTHLRASGRRRGRLRGPIGAAPASRPRAYGDAMNVITIDASDWKTSEDFYNALFSATRFSQRWERLIGMVAAGLRSPTQCSTTM